MEALQIALFLALVNERVVEYVVAPLFDRYWEEGRWLLMYVALVTGGLLSFLAGVDLLAVAGVTLAYPANLIVSAVLVGGGANLIHELFAGEYEHE